MISSPTDSGSVPVQGRFYIVEQYKSYICTGLAVLEFLFGLITAISVFPTCILAGIVQIIASLLVASVEASTFVSFLRFAAPIGAFFDGKPNWMKAAAYAVAAIIPCFFACFGVFFILGLIAGIGIPVVYAVTIIGPKASRDDMKYAAGGGAQPYSPTSP